VASISPEASTVDIDYERDLTFRKRGLTYLKMWGLLRIRDTRRPMWQRAVVLLAIFALTVSVATRVFHCIEVAHVSVHTDPSQGMRQHLAADAFVLVAPNARFAVMLLPVMAPHAPPVEPQIRTVEFDESLYNRPPPSLSLL